MTLQQWSLAHGHSRDYYRGVRWRHRDTFPKAVQVAYDGTELFDGDVLATWDAERLAAHNPADNLRRAKASE